MQDLAGINVLFDHQGQQQALDSDEGVTSLLRGTFSRVEYACQFAAEIQLTGVAGNRWNFCQSRFNGGTGAFWVATGTLYQAISHALVIIQQDFEQMDGRELLVALAQSDGLRALNEAARPLSILLDIHATLLKLARRAALEGTSQAAEASLMERPPGGAAPSLRNIWGGLRARQWFVLDEMLEVWASASAAWPAVIMIRADPETAIAS
jgi:hypothetical protein